MALSLERNVRKSRTKSLWHIGRKILDLLTRYRNRKYRLLRSRGRLSSVPYFLLTLCIFQIVHGCVLFVRLRGWAERKPSRNRSSLFLGGYRRYRTPLPRLYFRMLTHDFADFLFSVSWFFANIRNPLTDIFKRSSPNTSKHSLLGYSPCVSITYSWATHVLPDAFATPVLFSIRQLFFQ